jgi:hypothetical protein
MKLDEQFDEAEMLTAKTAIRYWWGSGSCLMRPARLPASLRQDARIDLSN